MKPWLLLPPQWAHDLGPLALKVYAKIFGRSETPQWKSVTWKNLVFKNPTGIAGGVDKNASSMNEWWQLGAGFLEIGTITPKPQGPNPGVIMDRDLSQKALWNKMGFPSEGAEKVFHRMNQWLLSNKANQFKTPVFINVGKNRATTNENATSDYLEVMKCFETIADVFVINISSPNTKGLRELQSAGLLKEFLSPLVIHAHEKSKKPLLLKLSPDMSFENFEQTLLTSVECGVDGFILTNTTLQRQNGMHFPAEGGVSGAPLKELSLQALTQAQQILKEKRKDLLIISAGGILSAKDIEQRLHLGADLVQIYSGLIFEGPGFFLKAAKAHE